MTQKRTINDLATIIRGVSYKPIDASETTKDGYIPLLRAMNIDEGVLNLNDLIYVNPKRVSKHQQIVKGDVVIAASTGSKKVIGKAAQSKNNWEGSFGAFCMVLRPNPQLIDVGYFGYFFQSIYYRKLISHMSSGANINNLKREYFDRLSIPVPSASEQERIVTNLDQADNLRQKRKQAIDLLDEYLKSVFMEMFGEDKTVWKSLKEISTFIDYRGKTPTKTNSGIRLITAKNVRVGYLEFQPEEFIAESDYLSWMRRGFPKEGDILFTTEAPLGNTAMLPKFDKLAFAQRIIIIQPKEQVKSEFLLFALSTPKVRSEIFRRSTGSTVKGIRSKELVNVKIPIPDIQKQEKFVDIYRSCMKLKNKMHEQSSELDNQFNALMQKHFNSN